VQRAGPVRWPHVHQDLHLVSARACGCAQVARLTAVSKTSSRSVTAGVPSSGAADLSALGAGSPGAWLTAVPVMLDLAAVARSVVLSVPFPAERHVTAHRTLPKRRSAGWQRLAGKSVVTVDKLDTRNRGSRYRRHASQRQPRRLAAQGPCTGLLLVPLLSGGWWGRQFLEQDMYTCSPCVRL